MTRVRQVLHCDDEELAARRAPRTDIVAERAEGRSDGAGGADLYAAVGGPFRSYERRVAARPAGAGRWELTETTDYRLSAPGWSWLFHFPIKRAIRRRQADYGYWWAPPDRLDSRPATVLALLCTVQIIDGYLGTVLTQTLTFAADEMGHGNTAQGIVLAVVRAGVLLALVTVALADRHGRRRLLLAAGTGSCLATAAGAASPTLWFLGGTQLVARGLATALGVLIVIMAVEEMPARSRAWAASVLVLCAGLGAGMAVWVLPVADLDQRAWRVVYLAPLLGLGGLEAVRRRLPESRRFEGAQAAADPGAAGGSPDPDIDMRERRHPPDLSVRKRRQPLDPEVRERRQPLDPEVRERRQPLDPEVRERRRRRLVLLAATAFLIAMFAAPASSLQNDFLKDERGFSAGQITLFTLATSTPAGIGVLVGGYLADRRGRRRVGAVGLVLGTAAGAWAFFTSGPALWLLTLIGTLVGGLTVPALAVYGPELFGTHDRGRANGLIVTLGVTGSATGLLTAGWLSDQLGGRLGPALALLAVGPLIVAALVLLKFPETAGLELEDLNPQDRPAA